MECVNIPAKFLLSKMSIGWSALCLNIGKHLNLQSWLSQTDVSIEFNFFVTKFTLTWWSIWLVVCWMHEITDPVLLQSVHMCTQNVVCCLSVCLCFLRDVLTTAILEETTLRKVCLFSERHYVEHTEGFLFWRRTFRVQKGTFIWLPHKKWCQKLILWTP